MLPLQIDPRGTQGFVVFLFVTVVFPVLVIVFVLSRRSHDEVKRFRDLHGASQDDTWDAGD